MQVNQSELNMIMYLSSKWMYIRGLNEWCLNSTVSKYRSPRGLCACT